jgi:site-specific DNA recombinase
LSVWATYVRVSTEEQAKFGASLISQAEAAKRRAEELGALEVVEFADHGVPGDVLTRPGLTKLREAVANRLITGLVVYDPDRLARNLSHQLLITEELQSAGVKLEFVNFEWKDTDEGRLFYSIRGAISEYEKAKIRERTSRGKWAKVKQGQSPTGRVPYGYLFDKPTKTIRIDEETSPWLRQMFHWMTQEGLGASRVANRLNALEVRPPARASKWQPCSIRKIIRNPAYMGQQIVHRRNSEGTHRNPHLPKEQRKISVERPPEEWMSVPVPTLIDDRTWTLAQEQLADQRRKYAGRPGQYFFLLQRIVACGLCESSMYGCKVSRSKNDRYYRCTSSCGARAKKCKMRHMQVDRLDQAVWELAVQWATNPVTHHEAILQAQEQRMPKTIGTDIQHLELQLGEVRREHAQLSALVAKGLVKPEHVGAAIQSLGHRAEALKQLLDDEVKEQALGPHWNPGDVTPLTRVDMDQFSPKQRQDAVRRYIARIFVYPDGKLRIIPQSNPYVVVN